MLLTKVGQKQTVASTAGVCFDPAEFASLCVVCCPCHILCPRVSMPKVLPPALYSSTRHNRLGPPKQVALPLSAPAQQAHGMSLSNASLHLQSWCMHLLLLCWTVLGCAICNGAVLCYTENALKDVGQLCGCSRQAWCQLQRVFLPGPGHDTMTHGPHNIISMFIA